MRLLFATGICTTSLLVCVFRKLGRGYSQNNSVHSSLSLLVRRIFFLNLPGAKEKRSVSKPCLGLSGSRERVALRVPCADGGGDEVCDGLWVFHPHTSKYPTPPCGDQKAGKHWAF